MQEARGWLEDLNFSSLQDVKHLEESKGGRQRRKEGQVMTGVSGDIRCVCVYIYIYRGRPPRQRPGIREIEPSTQPGPEGLPIEIP